MLSKKRPVRLFPLIAGTLEGANHPIRPNPITFKSLLSQSLWKHVALPPEAFATLKGFLAVTGDLTKSEERLVFFAEENPERDELAKPTTLDIVAAILVFFFSHFSHHLLCIVHLVG